MSVDNRITEMAPTHLTWARRPFDCVHMCVQAILPLAFVVLISDVLRAALPLASMAP